MPFTKGDPNINRNGRPKKGFALNEAIEKASRKTIRDDDGKRRKRLAVLADTMWNIALKGDVTMLKYLADRLGGKPTEKVEISGEEGGAIGIVFLPGGKSPDEWINEHGGNSKDMDPTTEAEDSTGMSGG